MRKRSKLSNEITESCRWWKGGIKLKAQWTFEGSPKLLEFTRVGAAGNQTRYQ